MAKKILIVNQNSGYLTIDVANAFQKEYDEVVVMFGLNKVTERYFHPDIKIQKTFIYDRGSNFKRLLSWSLCSAHLFFLLIWKYRAYKVLYYTNPPMSYFNALFFPNPFSIVIFDIYPDALKLIKIKESSLLFRIWVRINKKVFKKANKIITLSEGMKKQLTNYVDEKKIQVVPVWSASNKFRPMAKEFNPFLKQEKWEDKFIVLYSGNMGIGHKLEVLIDVADNVKNYKEILFLFIGEGAKKKLLINLVEQKKLSNVSFLTWQDSNILPYSLASGDIAVVALEPEVTHASVPSKTFNYMAVGAPILAIGGVESELEKLIIKHEIGYFFSESIPIEISNIIINLFKNKKILSKFSDNSLKASKNYQHHLSRNYLF